MGSKCPSGIPALVWNPPGAVERLLLHGLQRHTCPTMVITMACRGISSAPETSPAHPSLSLGSAELFSLVFSLLSLPAAAQLGFSPSWLCHPRSVTTITGGLIGQQ